MENERLRIFHSQLSIVHLKSGAQGGTRTPTDYSTRPSNVRGYQLRHLSDSKANAKCTMMNAGCRSIRCELTNSYFFAGALAGAFAGALAAGLSAGVFAAGAAAFAFVSVGGASVGAVAFASAGAAVFAFASDVLALVFELDVSAGASGLADKTETLPVSAGIARNKADIINVAAAMIVILDKTVAVPRGANAELDTLLVNRAPASVLPGCSRTDATSTMQEIKNSA